MRCYVFNYEIVFLVYPDKTMYIKNIVNHYINFINNKNGKIHRLEDWGLRYLSYPIKNMYKAHYILMNIEINKLFIKEIESNFIYNDSILRFIILKKEFSEINSSFMNKKVNKLNFNSFRK